MFYDPFVTKKYYYYLEKIYFSILFPFTYVMRYILFNFFVPCICFPSSNNEPNEVFDKSNDLTLKFISYTIIQLFKKSASLSPFCRLYLYKNMNL